MGVPMTVSQRRVVSVLIFLPAAAVFGLFAYLSQPERGLLAAYSIAVILTAVYIKWRLRHSPLFWAVIISIVLLHAVAVAMTNVSRLTAPGVVAVPLCILDLAAIFGFLSAVEAVAKTD